MLQTAHCPLFTATGPQPHRGVFDFVRIKIHLQFEAIISNVTNCPLPTVYCLLRLPLLLITPLTIVFLPPQNNAHPTRGIILVFEQKNIIMKAITTFSIVLSLFLTSCTINLSPYTSSTQTKTNFNEDQLKKVQFYLEGTITLYRELGTSETEITSGEIQIVNGKKVEQIVIATGTPGVVVKAESKDVFLISFDTDGSYLRFGANSDYSGRYTMMAKSWEGRTGIIEYAGKEYKSTSESIYAYLSVNMKKIDNTSVESKTAGGRTIE